MKIVVTGGTGFIGRPLVDELARLGHEVVVLSRTADRDPRPSVRFVRMGCAFGGTLASRASVDGCRREFSRRTDR